MKLSWTKKAEKLHFWNDCIRYMYLRGTIWQKEKLVVFL